jgi:electron transfer flavoprotein alpha/beta subunit
VARVRAAMKEKTIETVSATAEAETSPVEILGMTKPETAGHAEMLEGSPHDVATKICEVLTTRNVL